MGSASFLTTQNPLLSPLQFNGGYTPTHALLPGSPAIDHGSTLVDLPLDIKATAFQRRVWDALRRIPPGQTRSYSEVAVQVGEPKSVRAVARACATNPLAVVIPCHRVVRSDGSLSGYAWGVERKRALLDREQLPGSFK